MKAFLIEIDEVEFAQYAGGNTTVAVRLRIEEDLPDKYSELHLSEKTLRALHQVLAQIVRKLDNDKAVEVTVFPGADRA